MTPGDLVEIHWRDATTLDNWGSLADHREQEMAVIKSAGYLLLMTKDVIKLVQSVQQDPAGEVCASLTIPRGCIVTMRRKR